MKRRSLVSLFAAATAAALITGCSSTSSSSEPSSAASTPAVTTAGPGSAEATSGSDASLNAELPDSVRTAGKIVIGAQVVSPPFVYYDTDGKTPIGMEVDLAKAIAADLGVGVEYKDQPFSGLITSLQSSRIDMSMSTMLDKKSRQAQVDFVDYLDTGMGIMVQKGNPANITGPDTLCGKKVAAPQGSSQIDWAKTQSESCTSAGKAAIGITETQAASDDLAALKTGRIDADLINHEAGAYTSKVTDDGNTFQMVDTPVINGGPFGMGFNKDDPALRDAVQKAFQQLIDNGSYAKILDKYGMTSGAVSAAEVNASTLA